MKLLTHFEGLISDNVKVAKTFFSLMKLEAKLAALSIYPLVINACMLLVVLLTIWLSAMTLLALSIMWFVGNYLVATSLVLLFNLILMLILIKGVTSNLRKMSFEKTRESLKTKRKETDESKS